MANRPGLAALKQAARGGAFDVVVTEALDRLSRSQGDVATLFEDLRHQGVGIRTTSEGEVEELAIGLKGTMNALFLRATARKTRRGMVGVAQKAGTPAAASTDIGSCASWTPRARSPAACGRSTRPKPRSCGVSSVITRRVFGLAPSSPI